MPLLAKQMQKFSFALKFNSAFCRCDSVQFVQTKKIAEKENALKCSIRKYLMIESIEMDLICLESKSRFYIKINLFIHAPRDLPKPQC